MPTDIVLDPETFTDDERAELKRQLDQYEYLSSLENDLRQPSAKGESLLFASDREPLTLPRDVAKAIATTLAELAEGHAVRLSREDAELTTSEAAELLNVSRPFLVRLLDEGVIPHRKVGTHRRVRRADVLDYRLRSYQQSEKALKKLADLSQKLGMGYE